jgi:hypothetical protein
LNEVLLGWQAAVAEAAFMTGLEANSGVVRMASYAPLLANAHMRTWNPDMIVFDNHRRVGNSSVSRSPCKGINIAVQ